MSSRLVRLSKTVAHALRHEPWLYELGPDEEGWVPVAELLSALRRLAPEWAQVSRDDLAQMIASAEKTRYELDGDRIRALYGHSLAGRIVKVAAPPPAVLFHGTSPQAWNSIRVGGLRPMDRQYVHLSADIATAEQVGRRKSGTPVVLRIRAQDAAGGSVRFWRGNEMVWLADAVPPEFISRLRPGAGTN